MEHRRTEEGVSGTDARAKRRPAISLGDWEASGQPARGRMGPLLPYLVAANIIQEAAYWEASRSLSMSKRHTPTMLAEGFGSKRPGLGAGTDADSAPAAGSVIRDRLVSRMTVCIFLFHLLGEEDA